MEHLVAAVRSSVAEHNWYSALALALAMPDIACKLDGRPRGRRSYISWCEEYLLPRMGGFLTGADAYALRCAYLHEGVDDITEQEVREVLDGFEFRPPLLGTIIHNNQIRGRLQLQVDIFCDDICLAVETWDAIRGKQADVLDRKRHMLRILPREPTDPVLIG